MKDKMLSKKHRCKCGQEIFEVINNEGEEVVLNYKRKRMYVLVSVFRGTDTGDMGQEVPIFVDQWELRNCYVPHYTTCTYEEKGEY